MSTTKHDGFISVSEGKVEELHHLFDSNALFRNEVRNACIGNAEDLIKNDENLSLSDQKIELEVSTIGVNLIFPSESPYSDPLYALERLSWAKFVNPYLSNSATYLKYDVREKVENIVNKKKVAYREQYGEDMSPDEEFDIRKEARAAVESDKADEIEALECKIQNAYQEYVDNIFKTATDYDHMAYEVQSFKNFDRYQFNPATMELRDMSIMEKQQERSPYISRELEKAKQPKQQPKKSKEQDR